ncbi:MAG TPA: ferredoxin [Nocardioidaceae bacterium]|nr:ferredoxin [Nocardioidaceae bacterium]
MTRVLVVDWPSCKGRGLCHELLPEAIDLDDWGYPVVTSTVSDQLLVNARKAMRACPTLALHLVSERT